MNKNKTEIKTNIPPSDLTRNKYGLLDSLNYEFDTLGFVNYRKLIPAELLVPNRQIFEKRGEPIPKTSDVLPENELLVLLMGWRLIGSIRGYTSVDHQVIETSPESVTVKTTVCWIPNYETGYERVCSSSIASASLATTSSFAQNYLAEIASNRGFSRAVREFLRVAVLGFDEINP